MTFHLIHPDQAERLHAIVRQWEALSNAPQREQRLMKNVLLRRRLERRDRELRAEIKGNKVNDHG